MNARICRALHGASLSVCLFGAALMSSAVQAQTVTLYVDGDNGLAIQEHPRLCPDLTCDPACDGGLCADLLCSSWDYPCKYLQDALARAADLLAPPSQFETVQIWVAATAEDNPYRPHMCSEYHQALQSNVNTCNWRNGGDCNDCRQWSFHLQNNVELYGGFNGTESLLEERDWQNNVTVLSGDLDNNSVFRMYCDDVHGFNSVRSRGMRKTVGSR